jgi:hypothetical protein
LQLSALVVLLQPTLVKLQRFTGLQGAKDGYITPKSLPLLLTGERFFFASSESFPQGCSSLKIRLN